MLSSQIPMPSASLQRPTAPVRDWTAHISNTSQTPADSGGCSKVYVGYLNLPELDGKAIPPFKNIQCVLTFDINILVAFKVINASIEPGQRDPQKAIKYFNEEVKIFQIERLQHPNIARFLGVSYHMAGCPAIVMEWYQRGDVMHYLERQPNLPLDIRLKLVSGVLQGLLYLHTLDPPIVHGDLKGDNVLVSNNFEAALTDFGLSKVVEGLDTATVNSTDTAGAGTLRWKAPELFTIFSSGKSPASDVWAFGCTMYEILTGRVPYSFVKDVYTMEANITTGVLPFGETDPLKQVPPAMWNIVKRCWARNPRDRPSMAELAGSLEKRFISMDSSYRAANKL